jgi:hypothetical protein
LAINARTNRIEARAERHAHAVRCAVTAEAQLLHQCIEASVGHRPIGIEPIGSGAPPSYKAGATVAAPAPVQVVV